MARAKTVTKKAGDKKTKNRRHSKKTWTSYIYKTMKQVHKNIGMSGRAMRVMNSFCQDIFERIANEAGSLARMSGKSRRISSREMQTATRLSLPTELGKHAMAEGTKAVAKFSA